MGTYQGMAVLATLLCLAVLAQESTRTEETVRVEVSWRVWCSLTKDGSVVSEGPSLTVEIGIGREDDAPGYYDRPVLARVDTHSLEVLHVELDVPGRWLQDPRAVAWVRVATPGMAELTSTYPLHAEAPAVPALLYATPGWTRFGLVRTVAGAPVAGARIMWYALGNPDYVKSFETPTDAEGRFVIHNADAGPIGIHVRQSGIGSGGLVPIEPDLGTRRSPLELIVTGGFPLTGTLASPRGNPIAKASVVAIPAGIRQLPSMRSCIERERAGGLFGDTTETDEFGRFEFSALMPGEYTLHANRAPQSGRVRGAWDRPLASGVPVPNPIHQKLLCRKRFLVVSVETHGGQGVALEMSMVEPKKGNPQLDVRVLEDEIGAFVYHPRPTLVGDQMFYEVAPNRDYLVVWKEAEVPYQETRVHVGEEDFLLPVRLSLGPRDTPAKLTIRVTGPDGLAFEQPWIGIFSALGNYELEDSVNPGWIQSSKARNGTWNVVLPAGHYEVVADSAPMQIGCILPWLRPRAPHGNVRTEVELIPGADEVLDLRFDPKGHLDLHPRQARPNPLASALRRAFTNETVLWIPESGEPPHDLWFEVAGHSYRSVNWVVPGWPARCMTPLPVGRGMLRLQRGGNILFERSLEIRGGEVTTIEW